MKKISLSHVEEISLAKKLGEQFDELKNVVSGNEDLLPHLDKENK